MSLENLNFKKGLIRLFIVSIVGAPIYGLFVYASKIEDIEQTKQQTQRLQDILVKQVNNPKCDYVFIKDSKTLQTQECSNFERYIDLLKDKNNPKCDFIFKKGWSTQSNECGTLEIYRDAIITYKNSHWQSRIVTESLVRSYLKNEVSDVNLLMWFRESIRPVLIVLAFWFLSFIGFRILRWVYKGFKN